jgi:signal transduction histidine kinase
MGAVAVFVTALVGLSVRDVARHHVEAGFEERIDAAISGARNEIAWEADALSNVLGPLCKHDSFVDRTLLDLERSGGRLEELPPGLRSIVPDQKKALRLDDLVLITGQGDVVGASDMRRLGSRDRALARRLGEDGGPRLFWRDRQARLEVHCSQKRGSFSLGLIGARNVEPILERVGKAYGVVLTLEGSGYPAVGPGALERKLRIAEIPGLEVTASMSRQPLYEALAQIDSSIFLTGAIALIVSLALAVLFARGLSRPIVELALQTREVVRGSPQAVRGRGGRELVQLARSFNRTIEELAAIRRRLARTERIAARREVARQVAHEIKNPLAPIRAAVETLRRLHARQSPQFEEYFDEATKTVLDEVHRIKNIVSEFSKFARMPPPRFERVDLEELARGVVALHHDPSRDASSGSADEGSGAQVWLVAEPLPRVMADRDQLIQVLTNLVQNGIEAAAAVRSDPEVGITLRASSERELTLEIHDNGPGIADEVRDRLFEPYVSTKPEGTGLGLAIVQTILHEHGGEIEALEAEEGGALFVVTLPIDGPPLLEKAPTSTGDTSG